MEYLTYEMYKYAVRGYYEEHKFMFTLLLALKIDLQIGKLKFEEFQTLIKGGASLDAGTGRVRSELSLIISTNNSNILVPMKPNYKWLQNEAWLNLVELSKLFQFSDILNSVGEQSSQFVFFYSIV